MFCAATWSLVPIVAGIWAFPQPSNFKFSDGETLVDITKAFGGSLIVEHAELYNENGLVRSALDPHRDGEGLFQAVVVEDSWMFHEPELMAFVADQYHRNGVSVVVLSIEGIFNMSPINNNFGVNWRALAYTTRSILLTDAGHRILTSDAFSFSKGRSYIKALFVHGGQELFVEYIDPADYEDESDGEGNPMPVPPPGPGSPVVVDGTGNARISYFGFVNRLDVHYGAIVLRLCFASSHDDPRATTVYQRFPNKRLVSTAAAASLPAAKDSTHKVESTEKSRLAIDGLPSIVSEKSTITMGRETQPAQLDQARSMVAYLSWEVVVVVALIAFFIAVCNVPDED